MHSIQFFNRLFVSVADVRWLPAILFLALSSIAQAQPKPEESFAPLEVKQMSPFAGGARDDGSGFSINGQGFFGCGSDASFNTRKDWYRFEPKLNSWTNIADMPRDPRQYATALSDENKGYVFGGILQDGSYSNLLAIYDPLENTWQALEAPMLARGKSVGFNIGSLLYFGTGIGDSIAYNDWWQYNTMNGQWQQLDTLPFKPRYEMVGFAANGFGYLLLGQDSLQTFNEVWQFNPLDQSWRQLSDFPGSARTFATAISEPYGALVAGGNAAYGDLLDEIYHYEASSDKWTRLDVTTIAPIRGMEGFRIGSSVYLIGGLAQAFTRMDAVHQLSYEAKRNASTLKVWPNPVARKASLFAQYAGSGEATLEVFSSTGCRETNRQLATSQNSIIELHTLDVGLYFVRLTSSEGVEIVPLMVVN